MIVNVLVTVIIIIITIIIAFTVYVIGRYYYYQCQNSNIEALIREVKKNSQLDKLDNLKKIIDSDIEDTVFDVRDPTIREVCKYAVLDGKRIRPIIGYS